MGKTVSLANPIKLDVVKPHVVLICGKRGGGKSYTMGVMAEGMATMEAEVRDNIACLFVDTMGIYWTTKYPNLRDSKILDEWDMEPEGFTDNTIVFVPHGIYETMKDKGVPVDKPFSVSASELGAFEWCSLLNVSPVEPIGIIISRCLSDLLQSGSEFGIKEIISAIQSDPKADNRTKEGAVNLFEAVDAWGLFSAKGTPIDELIQRGRISIVDVSYYSHHGTGFSIRAMVIGLLARTVLRERMAARRIEELAAIGKGWRRFKHDYNKESRKQVPLVWMFIDEAHEFLPLEGETLASNALVQLLREGRQPGISLVLATQQPGKIHTDAMTQSDIIISHRLTSKLDIDALNNIMHTYLPFAIQRYLNELPKMPGSAIVLDDKQEKMYPIQVRPRVTWHGGEAPSAMPPEEKGVLKK
jgi:hypothetical protein